MNPQACRRANVAPAVHSVHARRHRRRMRRRRLAAEVVPCAPKPTLTRPFVPTRATSPRS
jgi:hypothetical protein